MPIDKIQLRGISRSPSDLHTTDGGCAESLNVQTDFEEIAPAIKPEDLTAREDCWVLCGLPPATEGQVYDILYIHKQTSYRNYICKQGSNIGYWVKNGGVITFSVIYALSEGETIDAITSIGNTIILSTSANIFYVKWKNGEYTMLGSDIPVPHLTFRTEDDSDGVWAEPIETTNYVISQNWADAMPIHGQSYYYYDAWRIASDIKISDNNAFSAWNDMNNRIQAGISTLIVRASNRKDFLVPVLLRYGVRLYDGTYKHITAPVLVSNDWSQEFSRGRKRVNTEGQILLAGGQPFGLFVESATVTLGTGYKVYFSGSMNLGDWGDIISSVDIFCAEFLNESPTGEAVEYVTSTERVPEDQADFLTKTEWENADKDYITILKEQILKRGPFFRVAKIEKKDISAAGIIAETEIKGVSQDYLFSQPTLKDNGEVSSLISFKKSYTYNSRLILSDIKERLYPGPDIFSSVNKITGGSAANYTSFFYINTAEGDVRIVRGMNNLVLDASHYIGNYIACPNAKCFKAEVYRAAAGGSWERKTFTMEEHPLWINCAFSVESVDSAEWETVSSLPTVNDIVGSENKILVSEVANPFSFPLIAVNTFSAKILGFAAATTALSTGQFGQFPLYVFTLEGIEALQVASDGSFVAHHPVSRDVALEGSITPIDQAVVYATQRSVMLLTGSETKDLSPYMNGRHYVVEREAADIIKGYEQWKPLVLNDTTPFISYVRNAVVLYDYIGRRLIFVSPVLTDYQYIYKLDSATWHKLTLFDNDGDRQHIVRILNSYPEAYAQVDTGDNATHLFDFSNALNPADVTASRGLIATRTIDFGQPEVYKTITRLKIRGNYLPEREELLAKVKSCQYVLLGSNDGVCFNVLHSLRGPSWRFFRIILLSNLLPTDRISYIEIEWEPRFTNKLR